MVRDALAEAGVEAPDAVIVGTGPGAFTGLRAGLVTARVLARAWDVPLYGVSSLDVMALAAVDAGAEEIVAMIDARRKEAFVQRFRALGGDDVMARDAADIWKPADLAAACEDAPAVVAVSETDLYPEVGAERCTVAFDPCVMVRLVQSRLARVDAGEDVDLGTEPQYLRRPDVHGERTRNLMLKATHTLLADEISGSVCSGHDCGIFGSNSSRIVGRAHRRFRSRCVWA